MEGWDKGEGTVRRSPIRHPVRGHTREGKTIGPYSRGSGKRPQKSRRVVGHSVLDEVELTHRMFDKVNSATERKLFGWCGMASVALAYQVGGDVVFGRFKNDEMYGGEKYLIDRGEGMGHVWVEKGGMIYDPTGEQFEGVTGPVVTVKSDKRYIPYNEDTAWEVEYDSGVEQPLRWENTLIRRELMQTKEGENILKEQSMSRSKIWELIGATK